jgi:lipoate-protein ligase A
MLNSVTKKPFVLVDSKQSSAKDNMRIDKELFNSYNATHMPIFRVYTWKESFTYGISQNVDSIQNIEHITDHAQRMTGGGILFHGNDISYSLIVPTNYLKNLSVKESYEMICMFLMNFYTSLGLKPMYAKDVKSIDLLSSEYCQQGYEPYDILVEGKKVGGNAQRRSKHVIFQHGSISIDNSTYSMGTSLEDIGVKISFDEAKRVLVDSFKDTFNVVFKDNEETIAHAS